MKTSFAVLLMSSTLVAHSVAYAQPAYTPEECKRMRPLMLDQLNKAQDRFAKAKAAARDALPFLNRVRDEAIRNTRDQTARDAAYLATISLNTVAQSVVDIMKLNPINCAAAEGASVSAKVFLEGVTNEAVIQDVVLPTVAQGREGRTSPDFETKEATALALAGVAFGCTMPIRAAITAGYNLGKNVAEVSTVAGDVSENRGVLLDAIQGLERQMQKHQVRLIMTGRKLQEAAAVRKDLEASCASTASTADSSAEFKNLIALADQVDKQDKLDLRSALDRAEQCSDMNCVTEALAGASKLTRGSGDRMLVFKARERADVRVGLLMADEEIRKKNIARAEQNKQAAAQAAQADEVDQAVQAAIMGVLVDTATSLLSGRVREATQMTPQRETTSQSGPTPKSNSTVATSKEDKCTVVRADDLPCVRKGVRPNYGYRLVCSPGSTYQYNNDSWCSSSPDRARSR